MIDAKDPLSARSDYWTSQSFQRDDWNARIDTQLSFTMTKTDYVITGTFSAWDDDKPFFERSWKKVVPRILS